jgi:hypothetical protein
MPVQKTVRISEEERVVLKKASWEVVDLPAGSFKESGTMVNTVLVILKKDFVDYL